MIDSASIAYERIRQAADPRAVDLYEASTVCDMATPWASPYAAYDDVLPRFASCGFGSMMLTVQNMPGASLQTAVTYAARVRAEIARRGDRLRLCQSVSEIRAAKAEGKLALVLQHQDGTPLGTMPEMVEVYRTLGVMSMIPVYNGKNMFGDGCAERTNEGLSRIGEVVVREMLRVGVMVDATHVGARTSFDMAELCAAAGKPLMFTHSNMHAVYPHYRNITDAQVKAAAATRGVVGVNGLGEFLPDDQAGSEAIFAHLDHLVTVAGPEHAGLGLDYLNNPAHHWSVLRAETFRWPALPFGKARVETKFAGPEQALELCDLMVGHGWTDEAVRGVLGENFLRAAALAWGG